MACCFPLGVLSPQPRPNRTATERHSGEFWNPNTRREWPVHRELLIP